VLDDDVITIRQERRVLQGTGQASSHEKWGVAVI